MLEHSDVHDIIWPSNNPWGVPTLDINMQADVLIAPAQRWGQRARSSSMDGTYHFYTDDYKFTGLWDFPERLVNSGCRAVIEPNFSINDQMPAWQALHCIGRKRWLARFWQYHGKRVIVDLNVAAEHADLNLLGVPYGWRAYGTRAYSLEIERLDVDYHTACERRGADDVLFIVYGGLKRVQALCMERGWLWLPGDTDQATRRVKNGEEQRRSLAHNWSQSANAKGRC